MSKIEGISARVVEIPLRGETAFSTRPLDKRVYRYVEVESAAKIGSGFCYLGQTESSMALSVVNQLLSPILLGADALCSQRLWEQMYGQTLLHGRPGSVLRALSALDIAVWDLKSQLMEIPLWKAVGGLTDRARAYASGGYYQPTSTPDEVYQEVGRYTAMGLTDSGMLTAATLDQSKDIISARVTGDPSRHRPGIPMRRIATTAEQANVICFLLSSFASHVTGQSVYVDGGESMV